MQVITTKQELKQRMQACKQEGKTIGFVPTMGALHEGHLALFKRAVAENDICVGSIFVNPTQFNNQEDLIKYPRHVEKDVELLASIGVDYVFAPSAEEMYDANEMTQTFAFDFQGLDSVMEGKMRPGHFNGVVQVVSKLFHLIMPTRAYFGEKDFQQLAIIRYMVTQSELKNTFGDLQIIGCPIVREQSGLALSSRNERLSAAQKNIAPIIYKTLLESKQNAKSHTVQEIQNTVIQQINGVQGLEVEYFEIVDKTTLLPTQTFENAIGCITVWCGEVRLIDNIQY